MEKQISAVEWLVDMLDIDKNDSSTKDVIQQAKAMEKEQIIDAYNNGEDRSAELYYNETFKSE